MAVDGGAPAPRRRRLLRRHRAAEPGLQPRARDARARTACWSTRAARSARSPTHLPLSIGDGELAETADAVVSVPEIFAYWLQGGRIDVGFLGAAQIDRFGNLNSTVIGDYDRPKVRLPGRRRRARDRAARAARSSSCSARRRARSSSGSTSARARASASRPSSPTSACSSRTRAARADADARAPASPPTTRARRPAGSCESPTSSRDGAAADRRGADGAARAGPRPAKMRRMRTRLAEIPTPSARTRRTTTRTTARRSLRAPRKPLLLLPAHAVRADRARLRRRRARPARRRPDAAARAASRSASGSSSAAASLDDGRPPDPRRARRDLAGERGRPLRPRGRPAPRAARPELRAARAAAHRRRRPLPLRHDQAGRLSVAATTRTPGGPRTSTSRSSAARSPTGS